MSEIILKEYRADVLENVHRGNIAVVKYDKSLIASLGVTDNFTYFRSASKPIQSLPTIVRQIPQKYNFTNDEIALFNSSHWGSDHHINSLMSMFDKAGLLESDLIMKPTLPFRTKPCVNKLTKPITDSYSSSPRRFAHNCSGKHTSLMLLQKELNGNSKDYWQLNSPAQQEVLSYISLFTEIEQENIKIGIDGCGVPVFAVPLYNIALSYAKIARPEALNNDKIAESVRFNKSCIHKYPEQINDFCTPIYYLNQDSNIIAKDGACGLICMALEKEGIGIAIKFEDGLDAMLYNQVMAKVLELLEYDNKELIKTLYESVNNNVINDNGIVVGQSVCDFEFKYI